MSAELHNRGTALVGRERMPKGMASSGTASAQVQGSTASLPELRASVPGSAVPVVLRLATSVLDAAPVQDLAASVQDLLALVRSSPTSRLRRP